MKGNKIRKTGLKRLHISKEVPTRHIYGEISQTASGKSACWGAFLKCLQANAHIMGNKYEELDICVHLQGCDPVGINGMWWDGLCDWSATKEELRLFRNGSLEK